MPVDRRELIGFSETLNRAINAHYNKFLGKELQQIIDANLVLVPDESPGYFYNTTGYYVQSNGDPYLTNMRYVPNNVLPAQLDPSLIERHLVWRKHYDEHSQVFPRIQQTLGTIMLRAKEPQDLRDMFPEHVHQLVKDHSLITGLLRSRPSLFVGDVPKPGEDRTQFDATYDERKLHWDPKLLDLYQPVAGIIDTYLGYRYLA